MLWPIPTAAQITNGCGDRKIIIARLAEYYDEVPTGWGLSGHVVFELFTAKDGESWTMLVSHPNGMSCVTASGEGWRSLERAVEEPET